MTSSTHPHTTPRRTVRWFEGLLLAGMLLSCIGIGSVVLDRPALGVFGDGRPFVDAEPAFPVDFGDHLATVTNGGQLIDAATSQPPMSIGKPITARFTFDDPSTGQRATWVIWQVSGPLLVLAGLWLMYSIVRSARLGNPFVASNERRLWTLAALIAAGGTGYSLFSGMAEGLLLERSAAAGLTQMAFTVSFLPLIAGLGVAVLASVWHVGIGLQDDVAGTI